jgi:hypothetical protein
MPVIKAHTAGFPAFPFHPPTLAVASDASGSAIDSVKRAAVMRAQFRYLKAAFGAKEIKI